MRRKRKSKKRISTAKKKKLMTELVIAMVGIIIIFVVLTTINVSVKTVFVDTEALWRYADSIYVKIGYANSTTDPKSYAWAEYPLSAIATYYNGLIYLSIPPKDGYPYVYAISLGVYGLKDINNETVTCNSLIEFGLNTIDIYFELMNSSDIGLQYLVVSLNTESVAFANGAVWYETKLISLYDSTAENLTTTIDKTISVDIGYLVTKITSESLSSYPVALMIDFGSTNPISQAALDGIKIRLTLYTVSQKRVYKFITEPLSTLWTAFIGAIVSFYEKIKSVAFGVVSGFGIGAVFTAFIENIYVSIALSTIFVIVFIYAISAKLKKEGKKGR